MREILFSFFLFFFSTGYAGFSLDTIILCSQEFIPIGQLQKNSLVISYDATTNNYLQGIVSNHRTYTSFLAYKVICDADISFVASPNQRVMAGKGWRTVKDIKQGDHLWCYRGKYVVVQGIQTILQDTDLAQITVLPSHTFFVTSAQIFAHNHPAIMITAAPLVTSIVPAAAKAVGVLGVAGAALYSLFAKKGGHRIGRNSINSSSNCSTPPLPPDDDDEFKKKHPHRRYEDATYHHKNSGGIKSPAPIDGQKALDNSLRIKDTKPHRIGISEDQFVVLRETSPGLFHGYVCEWEQLTDTMQKVLRKAQWVSHNGKIICK